MLDTNKVTFAGCQEARCPADEVKRAHGYTIFSSAAVEGQCGCQLWIKQTEHVNVDRFVVKLASPHMLCVIGYVENLRAALIVCHSPLSGHQDETIDAWWSGLRSMLMSLDSQTNPIVLMDGNARFECDGSDKQKPINRNGRHLERLLIDFELARTRPLDAFERQVVTWISPKLLESMIDYALLPQAWEANFVTLGEPDEALTLHSGRDHVPLLARVVVETRAPRVAEKARLDRAAMKDPCNRSRLISIMQSPPKVPWAVDFDTHVKMVHQHIVEQLRLHFPASNSRPKKSFVSASAWMLIRMRHALRKTLQRMHQDMRKVLMATVFKAWRQGSTRHTQLATFARRMNVARTLVRIRDVSRKLRRELHESRAKYVRAAFAEARGKGAGHIAGLLRGILKCGRKFRPPKTAPLLKTEGGEWETDPCETAQILGDHFAKAEHGSRALDMGIEANVERVPISITAAVEGFQHLPTVIDLPTLTGRCKLARRQGSVGYHPKHLVLWHYKLPMCFIRCS